MKNNYTINCCDMELIDKSALVAEIEKRLKANGAFDEVGDEAWAEDKGMCEAYRSILSFLDTLEVKEVDLEKEINKYVCDNFFGSQTLGFFATRTKEEPNDQDIALCAKHFFELGLKAKGE